MIKQSNRFIQEQEEIKTIYFTTSSFTYVYDHQVNNDATNISEMLLQIQMLKIFVTSLST